MWIKHKHLPWMKKMQPVVIWDISKAVSRLILASTAIFGTWQKMSGSTIFKWLFKGKCQPFSQNRQRFLFLTRPGLRVGSSLALACRDGKLWDRAFPSFYEHNKSVQVWQAQSVSAPSAHKLQRQDVEHFCLTSNQQSANSSSWNCRKM